MMEKNMKKNIYICIYHIHVYINMLCCAQSLQSSDFKCPTLWDPMNYSPPGTSVHRILQASILEWVAMPFSKGSSWPRNWTCIFCVSGLQADPLPTELPGKSMHLPKLMYISIHMYIYIPYICIYQYVCTCQHICI